jgi:hypothetical protein
MARSRSFQTAAARRRNDPIVWNIDGTDIRLRASVDLSEIAPLVDELQAPTPKGANQVGAAVAKREAMVRAVLTFIEPDDRDAFGVVEPDIDMQLLVEMVQELVTEYAGAANPTKPSPSSDGSDATGASSTDGAAPEASTRSA